MGSNDEGSTPGFGARVWAQWRRAAHAIGVVQTRFIMLLIYALVVVPTGLFVKMTGDPLHLDEPEDTNCIPARQDERTLDNARRQF